MKKTQILIDFRKIAHGIFHHRLLFQCRLLLKFRKFSTVDYYSMSTIIRDLRVGEYAGEQIFHVQIFRKLLILILQNLAY